MPQQSAAEPRRPISWLLPRRPRRSLSPSKAPSAPSVMPPKHLADGVTHLEATQKHVAESLKSSGQSFQTSVQKALAEARASAQKISEAVAAKRSAASK